MTQNDASLADDRPINIAGYLASLLRFWLVGVIVFVLVAVGGWFVLAKDASSATKARSMHLQFNPGQPQNPADAEVVAALLQEQMRTYSNLADSEVVLDATSAKLKGKWNPTQLATMVDLYYGGGSFLMRVDVVAPSNREADMIAKAYSQAWVENLDKIAPPVAPFKPTLTIVQEPFTSPALDGKSAAGSTAVSPMRLMAAVVAGAAVMAILAMALAEAATSALRRRKAKELILAAETRKAIDEEKTLDESAETERRIP